MPAWIVLSVLATVSCQSVFHRSQALLPPDPGEQLALRIGEARAAESEADAARVKLDARLARGVSGTEISYDVDRLELKARDLKRRVAAVRDLAKRRTLPPEYSAEIRRLDWRADSLLKRVKAERRSR